MQHLPETGLAIWKHLGISPKLLIFFCYSRFNILSHCCHSHRNQSFNLQNKSNDVFLYDMKHWAEMG